VFPLQFDGPWIPLGWAVEGVVLWWFGLRAREQAVRWFGAVLLGAAVARLIFVDTPALYFAQQALKAGRPGGPFLPLLNTYTLPALAVAGCLLGAAAVSRRFFPKAGQLDRGVQAILALSGVLLVWFVVSQDVYSFVVNLGSWN